MATYTNAQPFVTTNRVLLETKEARREYLASEVLYGFKNKVSVRKLGSWQGVPIFFTSAYLVENPYAIAIGDPYTGKKLSCHPQWFEESNVWRVDSMIEQFFGKLPAEIEEERARIRMCNERADEFEVQARALFPYQHPWQTALVRKQELDRYIDFAAGAHSPEAFQQLAEMRQTLLETTPPDLMERPRPKSTAMFVLPPRNPNTQDGVEATRIDVEETGTKEQSIEEVARTIQQSVVGSKATVTFGRTEDISRKKRVKKQVGHAFWDVVDGHLEEKLPDPAIEQGLQASKRRKGKKGELVPVPPSSDKQNARKTDATATKRKQPQSEVPFKKKGIAKQQGPALWDSLSQEPLSEPIEGAGSESQQLTLW